MSRFDFIARMMRPAAKDIGLAPDYRTAIDEPRYAPAQRAAKADEFGERFNQLEALKAEIVQIVEDRVRADFGERAAAIETLARNCAGVMRDNGQETLAKMIEAQALIFTRPTGTKP